MLWTATKNHHFHPRLFIGILLGTCLFSSLLLQPAEGKEKYREVTVSNGAVITGRAFFKGPPPESYVIWVTKDADIFGEKVPDERLIVSPTGQIKNVLILIEGIMEGKPWPDHTARLSNKGGRFIPHFQTARKRTKLEMINRDPVLHNTHAMLRGFKLTRGSTYFNLAQPLQDVVIKKLLRRAGMLEIVCDVHDWMNGWIAVLDHPYHAVTPEDGTFEIRDIPAGTYDILAWHEKLGRQRVRVTLKAGEQKSLAFEFPVK